MGKQIVSLRPAQKKGTPEPPKPLTLADLTVTYATGNKVVKLSGPVVAALIQETEHLHAQGEQPDYVDTSAIAWELHAIAETLRALSEAEDYDPAPGMNYLSDQLVRLSKRTFALQQIGYNAPDKFQVEVTK